MTPNMVIELAPFRLKPGVTDEALARASEDLQRDFLASQPGFLRRELLRGRDGEWMDLVHWTDDASASAVMGAIAGSPVCHRYFALMADADTGDPAAGVKHFHAFRTYRAGPTSVVQFAAGEMSPGPNV
jgi:hypothetical protein